MAEKATLSVVVLPFQGVGVGRGIDSQGVALG